MGYGFDAVQFSSGIEYRLDEAEQLDMSLTERTTWLFRTTSNTRSRPTGALVGKLQSLRQRKLARGVL